MVLWGRQPGSEELSSAYRRRIHAHATVAQVLADFRRLCRDGLSSLLLSADLGLPPRPGDTSISKRWLARLLRSRGLMGPGDVLLEVEIEDLDANRGFSGAVTKIVLSSSPSSSSTTPSSLILKMTADGVPGRRISITGARHKEARMYASRHLMSRFPPSYTPTVLYAYGSWYLGEAVMVMEDLMTRPGCKVVGINFVFGNQVWGLPSSLPSPLPDPLDTLTAIYRRTAELHAAFWRDKRLLGYGWLKGAAWYHGRKRGEWESAIEFARQAWTTARERAHKGDYVLSEKLAGILESSLAGASWAKLQAHLQAPTTPWTLCHGDFHASNGFLLLPLEGGKGTATGGGMEVMIFDWTEVGPWEPTTDLAQAIISDVKPALFEEHCQTLVRAYHRHLLSRGVPEEDFPWARCWERFVCGGVERWLWLFPLMAGMEAVPGVAVQYFHDQLLSFIEAFTPDRTCYDLKPVVAFF